MADKTKQSSRKKRLELQGTVQRWDSLLFRTNQSLNGINSKRKELFLPRSQDKQLAMQQKELLALRANAAAQRKLQLIERQRSEVSHIFFSSQSIPIIPIAII